jgi:hypothetical protein
VDITGHADQEEALQRLATEETQRPFVSMSVNTYCYSRCITSSSTAGRSAFCCATSPRSTKRHLPAKPHR